MEKPGMSPPTLTHGPGIDPSASPQIDCPGVNDPPLISITGSIRGTKNKGTTKEDGGGSKCTSYPRFRVRGSVHIFQDIIQPRQPSGMNYKSIKRARRCTAPPFADDTPLFCPPRYRPFLAWIPRNGCRLPVPGWEQVMVIRACVGPGRRMLAEVSRS